MIRLDTDHRTILQTPDTTRREQIPQSLQYRDRPRLPD
jgi:hypothetical protein